jgi:hypothetical protein
VPLELPVTGSAGWDVALNAALTAFDVRTTGSVNVRSHGALGNGVADDTAAVNAAIAAVAGTGGEVFFPPGAYLVSSEIVVPGGVLLRGTGIDYSVVTGPPARGSIIRATGAMASVVRLGSDSASSVSGQTGASMWGLVVDGANLATAAVKTFGRRNYIQWCQVWRGASRAVELAGQNSHVDLCILGQNTQGVVLLNSGADNKVFRSQIREGLTAQVHVKAGPFKIEGCHMWTGANGQLPATTGRDIYVEQTGSGSAMYNILIVGNTIEGVRGPHIELHCNAGNSMIENVGVIGNSFYNLAFDDDTHSVLKFNVANPNPASGPTVRNVNFIGNNVYDYASQAGYRALFEKVLGAGGTGFVKNLVATGNVGRNMNRLHVGLDRSAGDIYTVKDNRFITHAGVYYATSDAGRQTFTGDGVAETVSWPHGLSERPRSVRVTPGSAAAAEKHYVTADATNITVVFAVAPAAAAVLTLEWDAEV